MPVLQFPSVGLSHQSKKGILTLDDDRQVIEFKDQKESDRASTLASPQDRVVRATWMETGRRDATLQFYMTGYETQDVVTIKEEGTEGDTLGNGQKHKSKSVPRFYRIFGLSPDAEEKVRGFLRSTFDVTLESILPDVRGINFGEAEVSKLERSLIFRGPEDNNRQVLELPLSGVSQLAVPTKNEIEIQYSVPNKDDHGDHFELSLVRLYVPTSEDEPVPERKEGEPDEENEDQVQSTVDRVHRQMKEILDMYDEADEATLGLVCTISEDWCNFTAPKGKYRMDLYKEFLRLRGKSYDYKIAYDNIIQMHLLDHPEQNARFLVVSLESGVRVGQQVHPYLVALISDEEGELDFAMSEEELTKRYPDGQLPQGGKGRMPEVIAKVLKVVSGKKVFVMPATGFQAHRPKNLEEGDRPIRCVRATYKTSTGFLYPMKSSLMFLPSRPVLNVSYKDIKSMEFRAQQSGRAFNLVMSAPERQKGVKDGQADTFEFMQIPREQFEVLSKFFAESTSITIKDKAKLPQLFAPRSGLAGKAGAATIMDLGGDDEDDDDEDDSDFASGKRKKEKKEGDGGEGAGDDDDDDDDESSGGSGSSSDDSDDSDMAEEVSEDEDMLRGLEGGEKVKGKRERVSGGDKKRKKTSPSEKTSPSKKKRDPNLPKNARNAYTFFTEEKARELKAKNEGKPQSEIMKMLGDLWRELTDKSQYEEAARKDKERHVREMEKYRAEHPEADGGDSKKKKAKDKNAPKGARTAYAFFQEEMRPTLKEKGITSLGDQSKQCSDLWKHMTESDKSKYNEMAAQDKTRYQKDMEAYRVEHPASGEAVVASKKRVSTGDRPAPKKKVALGGGELPSDDDSSSDDSSSDDDE